MGIRLRSLAPLLPVARLLVAALVFASASGFATCGSDAPDEDEESVENSGAATDDEMMDDAIRDSDR